MCPGIEQCGWCCRDLPEPGFEAWVVAQDRWEQEVPVCAACLRQYKPLVVRIETGGK